MIRLSKKIITLAAISVIPVLASGCNTVTRLSEVGDGPKMSSVSNPVHRPDYRQVSMPMPAPELSPRTGNSLWRSGSRAFFKDQRASRVGDILTVNLDLSDKATFNNSTERARSGSEDTDVTNLLGFEAKIAKNHLPAAFDPTSLMSFGSEHQTSGDGKIDRKEEMKTTLAVVVTQVLPNGNLVIAGRQEVRVNYELRELRVTGVIRAIDITPANSITHDNIAEMRVSYGGRGTISDLQQPRWGSQVWDILFPF